MNGRVDFELSGTLISLHFGMAAAQMFAEYSVNEIELLLERKPDTDINELKSDNIKSLAFLIHAGLCNYADIENRQHPTFEQAYDITEGVLYEPEELQQRIFDAYQNSRATEELAKRLGIKKKDEVKDLSEPIGSE